MKDIFERIYESNGGPLGQYQKYADGYFQFPQLEGDIDPHMRFNGKEVLNLYRFAADEADRIYWKQVFGDKAAMDTLQDPAQREYARINYGPWDRLDGKAFVEGYGPRPAGAQFYPADMTAEEFAAWDNPDKNSRYTNLEMYLHYLVKDIVAGQNAGGSYMKL